MSFQHRGGKKTPKTISLGYWVPYLQERVIKMARIKKSWRATSNTWTTILVSFISKCLNMKLSLGGNGFNNLEFKIIWSCMCSIITDWSRVVIEKKIFFNICLVHFHLGTPIWALVLNPRVTVLTVRIHTILDCLNSNIKYCSIAVLVKNSFLIWFLYVNFEPLLWLQYIKGVMISTN